MHQYMLNMCLRGLVFAACVAVVTAVPAAVDSRLNEGPRFQHVPAAGGIRLADTWLTGDSVARVARYTPDTQNVYHLFSRDNPTTSQPMLLGVDSLIAANFDPTRSTVVIIHGWSSGPTSAIVTSLVPSILAVANVNVIVVDWSAGAYEPNYYAVVANNLPVSGDSIARFIFWLNASTGASLDTYHVIGFEAGAHMAGVVGRTLGGLVPYITALEPPRPGFILNSNAFDSSDGVYTECIHTNAGTTGLVQQVADVDFYPNGGAVMAGCEWTDWECSRDRFGGRIGPEIPQATVHSTVKLDEAKIYWKSAQLRTVSFNHLNGEDGSTVAKKEGDKIRAYQYLAESIVSGGFTGTQCDNVVEALAGNCEGETTLAMGGLTAKTGSTGIYYLTTNAQSPFSTG